MKETGSGHYSIALLIAAGVMVVETNEKRKHATCGFEATARTLAQCNTV
jgi:hypothetical protein